jgi:Phosphotransferase enzyme family
LGSNPAPEVRLGGGSMSQVVRVGDTVRRGTGRWTPAVHALLTHLERAGFDGAPRVQGIDGAGREVLTFLAGRTAWPHADAAVLGVGRLLRRFHRAAATFQPPPAAQWRIDRPWELGDIVCHNDLQPANTVFRGDQPVGFIDWDLAGPAPAISDLARAAWNFIPLRSDAFCRRAGFAEPPDRAHRLRLLCIGYGAEPAAVLAAVRQVQREDLDCIERLGSTGVSPFAHFLRGGENQFVRWDAEWLDRHQDEIIRRLGRQIGQT